MPTEVFEELIDLQIHAVESLTLAQETGEAAKKAYPYTVLRPTDELRSLTTPAIVLQNDYLRVTVLPEIGGRIISIYDRRFGHEVLPRRDILQPEAGGSRGAWLRDGLQFHVGDCPRPMSMGAVDTQVVDNGELPGLWIGETTADFSFHAFIALPHDRAEIQIEIRAFNRSLLPRSATSGIGVYFGEASEAPVQEGVGFYDATQDLGLAILTAPGVAGRQQYREGFLDVGRFAGGVQRFWPRQVDTWSLTAFPFAGIGPPSLVSNGLSSTTTPDRIAILSARPLTGAKLFLLTEDDRTLEAVVDMTPGKPVSVDVSGLPSKPRALSIQDATKAELLRYEPDEAPLRKATLRPTEAAMITSEDYEAGIRALSSGDPTCPLAAAAFNMGLRGSSYSAMGLYRLGLGDYHAAIAWFDDALLYNGEDHLTWWYRALALRLSGDVEDEGSDLLNAHYLAPLEPALRAESFLRLPQGHGKGPGAILHTLAHNPEQFVIVAAMLIDAGLLGEASRFLDEALHHVDLPSLRYQLAYCYLTGSRMKAEGAEQMRLAARLPIAPPYPSWKLIESLEEAFPKDAGLKAWSKAFRAILGSNLTPT